MKGVFVTTDSLPSWNEFLETFPLPESRRGGNHFDALVTERCSRAGHTTGIHNQGNPPDLMAAKNHGAEGRVLAGILGLLLGPDHWVRHT